MGKLGVQDLCPAWPSDAAAHTLQSEMGATHGQPELSRHTEVTMAWQDGPPLAFPAPGWNAYTDPTALAPRNGLGNKSLSQRGEVKYMLGIMSKINIQLNAQSIQCSHV